MSLNTVFSRSKYIPIQVFPEQRARMLSTKRDDDMHYTFRFPSEEHVLLDLFKHGQGKILYSYSNLHAGLFKHAGYKKITTENKLEQASPIHYPTAPCFFVPNQEYLLTFDLGDFKMETPNPVYHYSNLKTLKAYADHFNVPLDTLKKLNPKVTEEDQELLEYTVQKSNIYWQFVKHHLSFWHQDIWTPINDFRREILNVLNNPKFVIDLPFANLPFVLQTQNNNLKNILLIISATPSELEQESWGEVLKNLDKWVPKGLNVIFSLEHFSNSFLDQHLPQIYKTRLSSSYLWKIKPTLNLQPLMMISSFANATLLPSPLKTWRFLENKTSVEHIAINPIPATPCNLFTRDTKYFIQLLNSSNLFTSEFFEQIVLCKQLNEIFVENYSIAKFNLWAGQKWFEKIVKLETCDEAWFTADEKDLSLESLNEGIFGKLELEEKKATEEENNRVKSKVFEPRHVKAALKLYAAFVMAILDHLSYFGFPKYGRQHLASVFDRRSAVYRVLRLMFFGPNGSFPDPLISKLKTTTLINFKTPQINWFKNKKAEAKNVFATGHCNEAFVDQEQVKFS